MKGKNISIVVFEIVLLGILVFGSVRLAQAYGGGNPSNVGHTADEIAAGTFAAGSFNFQNSVGVSNPNTGTIPAASFGAIHILNPSTGSGVGSTIQFNGVTSAGAAYPTGQIGTWNTPGTEIASGDLYLATTNEGGNIYERMRVTASGNVGIGTTTPASGFITFSSPYTRYLHISGTPNSANYFASALGLQSYAANSATTYRGEVGLNADGKLWMIIDASSSTSGKEEGIIIDRSGNVGIGTTTPSTWGGFDKILHIKGLYPSYVLEGTNSNRKWGVSLLGNGFFDIYDATAGANRMVIDTAGNVGIGTTSPSYKLQVDGPSTIAIQTNGEASVASLSVSSAIKPNVGVNTLRLAGGSHTLPTFANTGRVEVWDRISVASGYNYGTFPDPGPGGIYAVGTIYYGGLSGISDARFKENVVPLSGALSKVSELQGVSFDWKIKEYPERTFPEGRQIGMIAQDVEKVVPELVSTDKEGYKAVDYAKMNVLLIEAVKEQQAQIDQLKAEVESLKSR